MNNHDNRFRWSIVPILMSFANWIRYAGTERVSIDYLSDDMERAISGDRSDHPLHRKRHALLR